MEMCRAGDMTDKPAPPELNSELVSHSLNELTSTDTVSDRKYCRLPCRNSPKSILHSSESLQRKN